MHVHIRRFAYTFRLAVLALLIVALFATATTALAEVKTFGPCSGGQNPMTAETSFWSAAYHARTQQWSSGCPEVFVRLKRWENGVMTGSQHWYGVPYTYWADVAYVNGAIYTAKHAASTYPLVVFTSDNGTHSNPYWYCNGKATGTLSCW